MENKTFENSDESISLINYGKIKIIKNKIRE